MPGCVLRVDATTKAVEAFLASSKLSPSVVFIKGRPRVPGGKRLSTASGFNIVVSKASGASLSSQARDAVRFINRHGAELDRLRHLRGFRGATLDFGLWDASSESRPWPSYRLSAPLIEAAGRHSLEIHLSFYGSPEENGAA